VNLKSALASYAILGDGWAVDCRVLIILMPNAPDQKRVELSA
jgi:hypothetical protein